MPCHVILSDDPRETRTNGVSNPSSRIAFQFHLDTGNFFRLAPSAKKSQLAPFGLALAGGVLEKRATGGDARGPCPTHGCRRGAFRSNRHFEGVRGPEEIVIFRSEFSAFSEERRTHAFYALLSSEL